MIPAVYRDQNTGEYHLNETALFTRPYWLTTDPDVVVFNAAAIGATASARMWNPQEAPMIGEKLLAFEDQPYMVRMRDEGADRWIIPEHIHIDCITGTAQQPFLLQDPIFLDAESALHVDYIKLVAGLIADQAKLYLEGTRYYYEDANIPEFTAAIEKVRKRRFNNYPVIKTVVEENVMAAGLIARGIVLGANATAQYHVVIPNNYHFTIKKVTAVQLNGAAAAAFSIRYFDQKGNELGNGALDARAVIGTGLQPELLRQPFTVERNRILRLEVTDLSAAPNTIFIAFTGAAHYVMRKTIVRVP